MIRILLLESTFGICKGSVSAIVELYGFVCNLVLGLGLGFEFAAWHVSHVCLLLNKKEKD